MFWFDNSRKNLVVYVQELSFDERNEVQRQFSEITAKPFGSPPPILHFKKSDATVIKDHEIEFIRAIYRASSNKLTCVQSLNRCILVDGLKFCEENETIINERGTCAYISLIESLDGPKIRKIPKETDPSKRILQEIQIMIALNRIQKELDESYIIECAEDFDGGYIMECATDSLYQYILRINGSLERDLSINLALRIIDCVNFLHVNGVLHRDLHPGNWLFVKETLKIADFGLACNITDDRTGKGYKSHYGAMEYTAKEQKKSLENTTEQSDIYTVGRLLNFVFTKSSKNINHIFRAVAEKCIRSEPEQRYSSMLELKGDVLKILNDKGIDYTF